MCPQIFRRGAHVHTKALTHIRINDDETNHARPSPSQGVLQWHDDRATQEEWGAQVLPRDFSFEGRHRAASEAGTRYGGGCVDWAAATYAGTSSFSFGK
jgi:hypothetical protein